MIAWGLSRMHSSIHRIRLTNSARRASDDETSDVRFHKQVMKNNPAGSMEAILRLTPGPRPPVEERTSKYGDSLLARVISAVAL
jgi:hypothetical protein